MKIGFSLPQTGGQAAQATEIARYARTAEELGAASLWVIDRADGFMPAVVLPYATDLDQAVNQPLARIRAVADEHGRDAGGMNVILRIYPMTAGDATEAVVDMIRRTAAETEVDHVLVDLMYQVSDVDSALKRVEAVLAGAGGL